MISEKDLIKNLQALKQIKPNKNWVIFTKEQIVGTEAPARGIFEVLSGMMLQRKLAYATIAVFIFLISVFGLSLIPISDNSKFEAALLVAANESRNNLEIASQKLENLAEIAKTGDADKIAAAVNDTNKSIASASKTITKDMVSNPKALKEIAASVKKIDQNRNNLQTLGVMVDSDYQLNNVLQPLVQGEIESLEKATLNEDQQITLREISGLYKQGQYTDALEKILLINSN